jgi:hypothetical protein
MRALQTAENIFGVRRRQAQRDGALDSSTLNTKKIQSAAVVGALQIFARSSIKRDFFSSLLFESCYQPDTRT